ncbi:MAG: ThiF family adenylyltransferase, partial [Thermodesulfobacteriota bacterium]
MAERYSRNPLSRAEQEKLQSAVVSIIGCGGLGGRTAELLTRLGVGSIILTDPDRFTESNLNRQLFCS